MSKALTFTDKNGKEYTLEYNRKAVETMERQGFVASEVSDKPMTCLPALFRGAFLMHHSSVKRETIDELYSRLTNRQELVGKLAEMYNEPLMALLDEPEEDAGNIVWGANF